MKIVDSTVTLSSTEKFQTSTSLSENLKFWSDINDTSQTSDTQQPYTISISPKGLELSAESLKSKETDSSKITLSEKDKQTIALFEAFFEKVLGKKIRFIIPKDSEDNVTEVRLPTYSNNKEPASTNQQNLGWGLVYNRHEVYTESQNFSFDAIGSVKTSGGKKIDFNVSLTMSRSFIEENDISFKAGDALKDPLVINYAAPTALLSKEKISIDIDNDGDSEQISNLYKGSGFLTIDKNEDGKITSGNELFGASSGNGFKDLSTYDSDSNLWIDENDSIFNKLRIWTVDENEDSHLAALGEVGIGAIYLGNISTAFDLKNSLNESDGKIQRTGIFLKENGGAGTIQHVDLKV